MNDIEVFLDWRHQCRRVGLMRRHAGRGRETVTFEYAPEWLVADDRFSMDPALPVGPGVFRPPAGAEMFGTLGDSAPDTWGRMLMRRRERRAAERESRAVRTLHESDFLLGVSDLTRLGALRFRWRDEQEFQAPQPHGVPDLLALGELLGASERIVRGDESDDDLRMIFAPGSSLGGARPKASVIDQHGRLAIAKFPKQTDEYSLERWEAVALDLAASAGIRTAAHNLHTVTGRPVLLSRRFDRHGEERIPFLSAMSMTEHRDGERGSYLEIVDALAEQGANARGDRLELFKRVAFSILVSNVDDHLRNHGFLWQGGAGWSLSPAYDLNPTPQDLKARVLATNIDLDDGTCSIDLLRSVAQEFSLKLDDADREIRAVAQACLGWREVAKERGAPAVEIKRMESAFEHEDSRAARSLGA
ncbi:type II toxin-antitoxin system HipA family toxin [Alloalcanivorax mobilis]|uniref:type II toxin-antitoxin system HipA family toxin n=1 Tax=Alloalcanivorax mobilis TaxID=2019569 RepID=UPI000C76AD6A|nr:HipA domain-containing protein [Alloalcanivorax mobilis]